jgi:hypothetical protein
LGKFYLQMNTTISSKALSLYDARAWMWAAAMVAGNLLFPQLCHLMPLGGKMLLPVMLFTLIAAVRFGTGCAVLTAILSPLAGYAVFGAPSGDILSAVLVKSLVIALAFGLWGRYRGFSALSLAGLVIACQLICFPIEGALLFGFATSWNDLLLSVPGMLLQWVVAMTVIKYWK